MCLLSSPSWEFLLELRNELLLLKLNFKNVFLKKLPLPKFEKANNPISIIKSPFHIMIPQASSN